MLNLWLCLFLISRHAKTRLMNCCGTLLTLCLCVLSWTWIAAMLLCLNFFFWQVITSWLPWFLPCLVYFGFMLWLLVQIKEFHFQTCLYKDMLIFSCPSSGIFSSNLSSLWPSQGFELIGTSLYCIFIAILVQSELLGLLCISCKD